MAARLISFARFFDTFSSSSTLTLLILFADKGTLAKANATDATQSLNGDDLAAVVMDRDALQIWDNFATTLTTVPNPRGRYNNVFLNKMTTFALIEGLNCLAITTKKKNNAQA